MTEAEEPFFRALTGDAGDTLRRLIFADWLDERDDPRGEWVRLGCELDGLAENDDRRPALEAREQQLWEQHRDTVDEWDRRFALARIKYKLARATETKQLQPFNPALSEDELTAFEREHRVSLPEGYRAFLSEIGNGGPGPGEGLPSLAEAAQGAPTNDFATPFPLSMREWAEATERAESGDTDFPQEMEYEQPGVLWVGDPWKDWERAYLVVTGEDRGMVWGMGLIDGGWGPDVRAGYEDDRWEKGFRNFLTWYEDWLDALLAAASATPSA
jgi:uncharacterized protein (TIGR02996 family)